MSKHYLSKTQGRSIRTPLTSELPYDIQLASISPRPPPTSIIHLLSFQAYASFKETSPPFRLSLVKLVMACWKSSAKASFPSTSSYCTESKILMSVNIICFWQIKALISFADVPFCTQNCLVSLFPVISVYENVRDLEIYQQDTAIVCTVLYQICTPWGACCY